MQGQLGAMWCHVGAVGTVHESSAGLLQGASLVGGGLHA